MRRLIGIRLKMRWSHHLVPWLQRRLDVIDDVSIWYERELLSSQEVSTPHAATELKNFSRHTKHLPDYHKERRCSIDQRWCSPEFH